jgi:23S rRNA pseudouridine2605 synthase
MARRNSSGPARNRRGPSSSAGKPFKKSSRDSGSKPFRKRSDSTGDEKPARPFSKRSSGDFRDDKKPAGPFSKRSDSSGDEKRSTPFAKRSSGSFGDKKPFSKRSSDNSSRDEKRPRPFSNTGDEKRSRPFTKRSSGSFGDEKRSRPFSKRSEDSSGGFRDDKKSTRPFSKGSDRDSGDEKRSRPFSKRSSGDFGDEKKPSRPFTRRSSDSTGDEKRSRPFSKRSSGDFGDDKKPSRPFTRKSSDSTGDEKRPRTRSSDNVDDKKTNTSRDYSDKRPSKRPFKKFDTESSDTRPPRRDQEDRSPGKAPYKAGDGFKKRGAGRGKREESFSEEVPLQDQKIRLNRFIANSGVCSRREADQLILMGIITVNGKAITELGYKVNPGDEVRHEGKLLHAEKPVYVLMNKPKGFLTTTNDPQERNTVMQIIGNAVKERIYPVGRLDRNTTGLLLLTNDGDLADKLMHPSYNAKKIYKVELDRPLTKADFQKIVDGVHLEEGRAIVDDLAIVSDDGKTIGVEIHIGWNRVVRRIFEALEYTVIKLDRSVYAGLDKKDLPRGHWRFLSREEVVRLKHYKTMSK